MLGAGIVGESRRSRSCRRSSSPRARRCTSGSHTLVQPRWSNSREMIPAVKPHRMRSAVADQEARADAGPIGCTWSPGARGRAAPRSAPGGRACTSSGSTTSTGDSAPATSRAPWSPRSCSAAATARAARRRPRRRPGRARSPPRPRAAPAAVASASVGSIEPPGKETWPGWERMSWARSVSSRSGPAGPSPKSISTAPCRGLGALGRDEAGQLVGGDRRGALADRLEPVGEITGSQRHPEVLLDEVLELVERLDLTTSSTVDDLAARRRRARANGQPADPGNGALPSSRPAGRRAAGRSRRSPRASSRRLLGLGVLVVDAEHVDLAGVLLVRTAGRSGSSLRHGPHQIAHRLTTSGPRSVARSTSGPPPRQGRVTLGQPVVDLAGVAGRAVLDAGLGLELAQLGGVDVDLRRAGPGSSGPASSVRRSAAGEQATSEQARPTASGTRLMRGPRSSPASPRPPGRSGPRRTTGTSAPPGRRRRRASASGRPGGRARSGGG